MKTKAILLVVIVTFAVADFAAPALTKSQAAFFENRRIAVSRDTTTIPGAVITTWYRNGKPDTKAPAVVTNYLHTIVGAEQLNPLQADAKATQDIRKAAKRARKNLDKVLKTLEQAKKKAASDDEADLYEHIINILTPEGKDE